MGQESRASTPTLALLEPGEDSNSKSRHLKSILVTPWGLFCQIFSHVLALGATVGVIQLSLRNCFFADENEQFQVTDYSFSTNEALHAMQFAAKLHEMLMVGSLTNMVFHISISHLLGPRGVSLGLLTATFKLGTPEYLMSSELRHGFRKSVRLATYFFFVSVLVISLAPVSGVMLVPSLNWWHMSRPFSGGRKGSDVPVFVRAPRKDLWPMTMETKYDDTCFSYENFTTVCPQEGYGELRSWVWAYVNARRAPNVSIVEPLSGARRRIQSYNDGVMDSPEGGDLKDISWDQPRTEDEDQAIDAYEASIGMGVLATTSTHWIVATLGLFWSWAKSTNLGLVDEVARPRLQIDDKFPVLEPLVTVRCSAYDYFESRQQANPLTAPYVHNRFGDTGIATTKRFGWDIPASTWNYSRDHSSLNIANFTWVDLQSLNVNASIGAVFSIPYLPIKNGTTIQSSWVVPCTVEGRWIGSKVFYDPSASDMVQDNVTDPKVFSQYSSNWGGGPALTASDIVEIPLDWAKMLNVDAPSSIGVPEEASTLITHMIKSLLHIPDDFATNKSAEVTYYGQTFQVYTREMRRAMTRDLANILGFFVADAMSRAGYVYNIDVVYDRNATAFDLLSLMSQMGVNAQYNNFSLSIQDYNNYAANNWTQFNLSVDRWGYGYAINSKTTIFGLTVLCIFMAVVLVYLGWWAFITFRPRKSHPYWIMTTTRWSSIGELLALAINSPRSKELDGTCSGVEDSRVWKTPIRIREVEPNHLGLRVGRLMETDVRVTATGRYRGSQPSSRR